MEFTVKNLTMFMIAKERRWLTQARLACAAYKSESQIAHGKKNFTAELSKDIAARGAEIAAEIVTHAGINKNANFEQNKEKLLLMLHEIAAHFDLPARQRQRIEDYAHCDPLSAVKEFEAILGSLLHIASTSVAESSAPPAQPGALAGGMLKQALCRQIDTYIQSDIYLVEHRRTETIRIAADRRSLTRSIETNETYCNPGAEAFTYSHQRVFSWQPATEGETREELRARKLKDQILEINGKERTPQNLKLEERERAFLHAAQWKLSFDYAIDPAWERFTVRHKYTSTETLALDRTVYTFKLSYPCLYLHHTITLAGNDGGDWGLYVNPFEPFFAWKITGKKSPVTGLTDRNRNQATIEMDGPILPGSGYMRRIHYKERSTVDAYRPAFFEK